MAFRQAISWCAFVWVATACLASRAQDFTIDDDGYRLLIAERGQPVLGYTYRAAEPSADIKNQSRPVAGYFHPIHGLYGEVLTGESPSNWSGAPGVQWGWTRLGAGGKVVDLTRQDGGRREFERVIRKDVSESRATVSVQSVWLAGPDDTAQVLETLLFTVYPVEQGQRNIDVSVLLKSVAADKIYLAGSIPGAGLTLVLNPERNDWSFSGGRGPLPTPGTPFLSPLIICSYRDDRRSSRSGIVVFQDARNPGFSQPNWLVESPERLLAGVPESMKAELKSGEFLEFRYRLVLSHLSGSEGNMTAEYSQFMAAGQHRE
jgi:hypothetical protein